MLVGVYLDKSRVADTLDSAETVISEILRMPFKKCKQTNEQQQYKLTPAFCIFFLLFNEHFLHPTSV